ncbi:hypothetical protein PV325_007085 [Microctonus aethiopoides]|nr:hypothetical protein PV325_007085 [Microctonus aethiopoides]
MVCDLRAVCCFIPDTRLKDAVADVQIPYTVTPYTMKTHIKLIFSMGKSANKLAYENILGQSTNFSQLPRVKLVHVHTRYYAVTTCNNNGRRSIITVVVV